MRLKPEEIFIGERLRQSLNKEAVEELKNSIAQIGLRIPISVRQIEGKDAIWGLVTGRHRLQACIELGLEEIEVREEQGNELDSKLWEIAENLHRSELTVADRSRHITEWIRLTDEKLKGAASKEVSSQVAKEPQQGVGQGVGGGKPDGGINAAARELGIGKDEAYRAVKIDSLTDEAKAEAVASGLDDNQSALLEAAKEKEPAAQVDVLKKRAAKRDAPKPPKQKQKPSPKKPKHTPQTPPPQDAAEEADHELEDWVATFESWSSDPDHQQKAQRRIGVKDRELRELIAKLLEDVDRLEQENQSLMEQLEQLTAPTAPAAPAEPVAADEPADQAPEPQPEPPPQPEQPEQTPLKSREETIAAFENAGSTGLSAWQCQLMHIDPAVVKALTAEGVLSTEHDGRVRRIQPWLRPAA
jgi:ParB family chromosome partitioning protein